MIIENTSAFVQAVSVAGSLMYTSRRISPGTESSHGISHRSQARPSICNG